jgi:hypothetical protein
MPLVEHTEKTHTCLPLIQQYTEKTHLYATCSTTYRKNTPVCHLFSNIPKRPQGLAPADYFLFPKLKFPLKRRHFQTVEEIQFVVKRELKNVSKTAFLEGMKKLKKRANKCIDQGGMYFEE